MSMLDVTLRRGAVVVVVVVVAPWHAALNFGVFSIVTLLSHVLNLNFRQKCLAFFLFFLLF